MNKGRFIVGSIPHNKKPLNEKTCGICNEIFYVTDCDLDRKFCSKTCGYKGRIIPNLYQKGHPDSVPKESRGHTEKTKQKMSKTALKNRKFGELSPNWKGGKRVLSKRIMLLSEYSKWRLSVFERDNYTCECGHRGYLEAHHIITLNELIIKYNIEFFEQALNFEEFWDINNGITLCKKCHIEKHRKRILLNR